MSTIDYITLNDTYNGIYQSQVIDVVNHIKDNFNVNVRLIAFVPLRLWKSERYKIKTNFPTAKVYPIPGGVVKWRRCSQLLKVIKKSEVAICRGPIAFSVAHEIYEKCVYDGRAAVKAEVEEYNVTGLAALDKDFILAEKLAVEKAYFRIAVSYKLVQYWQNNLGISIDKSQYVILPCTLTSVTSSIIQEVQDNSEVKVIYSGGTSPWQSFDKVVLILEDAMKIQLDLKVIFLTKQNDAITCLINKYPDRVERKWLQHNEVSLELAKADYGILIRENKLTNRVASPVKFAEYLNAGLKVLISDEIGDFSEIARKERVGEIVNDKLPYLTKIKLEEKIRIQEVCKNNFYKMSESIQKQYEILIAALKLKDR